VILVSHDRFFLDAVVTRIAEISLRTITDYVGTYSEFLVERDARMERLRKAKQEQDDEIARMRAFIDRFRYQATKAAQVQSRIKMLDKIQIIEVPPERKRVHFTFPTCPKSGRMVLEIQRARKAYGGLVVLDDISLHVERGDRIALVAPNGAGKSTLMRLLAGAEAPDTGERREGHQVVMQYFAQDEANRLNPSLTVYETMESDSPVGMVPMIRNILGGFLFSGDDIYKRAGVLSGGERTRLAVARMLLRPANTLLLDEPTNHLDLDSKDVLLEALEDFGGTLIFVSHDRYFVDRLATKVIAVGHGSVEIYPGTYEQFLWSRSHRTEATAAPKARTVGSSAPPAPQTTDGGQQKNRTQKTDASIKSEPRGPATTPPAAQAGTRLPRLVKPATPAPPPPSEPSAGARYEEKKKADAGTRRQRKIEDDRKRRVAELEGRITERERAIKELEAQMAAPGFYEEKGAAEAATSKHHQLMWEVGDLMNQWEALQESERSP
jgi:ATP-binding cassette subfamily F protein 3